MKGCYVNLVAIGTVKVKYLLQLDIVGTVYHLVIYMQSNKIHKVILMSKFIQHLCWLDMFRTSSVHHQERFVQAVFADFGMCYYCAYYSTRPAGTS